MDTSTLSRNDWIVVAGLGLMLIAVLAAGFDSATVIAWLLTLLAVIAGGDNSYWDGFLKRTGRDYPTYFARQYASYAERVTFTGSISDDDLQQQYAACDLFVAPSLYESFGLIY